MHIGLRKSFSVITLTLYVLCFTTVFTFSISQHIVEKSGNISVRQGTVSQLEIRVFFCLI